MIDNLELDLIKQVTLQHSHDCISGVNAFVGRQLRFYIEEVYRLVSEGLASLRVAGVLRLINVTQLMLLLDFWTVTSTACLCGN